VTTPKQPRDEALLVIEERLVKCVEDLHDEWARAKERNANAPPSRTTRSALAPRASGASRLSVITTALAPRFCAWRTHASVSLP